MLNRLVHLPDRGSCLLLGPRQTGKSTLVRSLLPEEAWSVDLLHHETFLRYSKEPSAFRREAEARCAAGIELVFVDEIQRIPELLNEVHALIEGAGLRFWLTGSSARKLRRSGVNLLAGRAVLRHLHPLTREEQGDLFDLDRNLRLGSLPAVVTGDEAAGRDLLKAYVETYLREEVHAESLVRNLGGFARFLDVVAAQCGDLVNYSAVARDAAVATRTVQDYFQILVDTLVGVRLEPWRKSPRARLVAHPRFYLFDTGVTNAINARLTARLDAASRGRLFEQWLILECGRRLDYLGSEARLFFWRTHHGTEVDLLIERHGEIRAGVEIKAKRRIAGADLTGLRSFAEAHPGVPLFVASLVPEPFDLGPVHVLPYDHFLDRFAEWA